LRWEVEGGKEGLQTKNGDSVEKRGGVKGYVLVTERSRKEGDEKKGTDEEKMRRWMGRRE